MGGWFFKKQKKSIMAHLTDEQKKRLEAEATEQQKKSEEAAKQRAAAFKVVQIAEDPVTGNLSVNVIQNIKSQIEVMGIIYKGLKLIECEFNKAQQNRIITSR